MASSLLNSLGVSIKETGETKHLVYWTAGWIYGIASTFHGTR